MSYVARGLVFALAWWMLTDGNTSSWVIGIPAVLVAVMVSVMLIPPLSLVWFELLKFIPQFLWRSLIGGAQVARGALHPALPIQPDLLEYRFRLKPGLARVFMANTTNLLPGTLSTELIHGILKVHVLDARYDIASELKWLEEHTAKIFGELLPDV